MAGMTRQRSRLRRDQVIDYEAEDASRIQAAVDQMPLISNDLLLYLNDRRAAVAVLVCAERRVHKRSFDA